MSPGPEQWFLTPAQRGNRATAIDRGRDGRAWTTGNDVDVLIDGHAYFRRLHDTLLDAGAGDSLYLLGLEGNPDERLAGPDTEVGTVLAGVAQRGAALRGLVWRAHPGRFNQAANSDLARMVNRAGGEILLDNRIRRAGSQHQKLVVLRRHDRDDVAFVGGIDLGHGRNDDPAHRGDPQRALLADENYGPNPPWHDLQLEIRGPAIDDLAVTFSERWDDPSPIDGQYPWRRLWHRRTHAPDRPSPVAEEPRDTPGDGPYAIQVLRTYPKRRRPYPFAPGGERSIARAHLAAFARAERLIYLEDQYLWSTDAADAIAAALRRAPDLRVVCVVPRHPDVDGPVVGAASHRARERVRRALLAAGGDRVAVYDLENGDGTPIYVHSKVCVVDDVWLAVGSSNVNRRSWSHDAEVACAVMDTVAPTDGDTLARRTRLRLACEHLGRTDGGALVDPDAWFAAFGEAADALDGWHRDGEAGPRPTGRLRVHPRPDGEPRARLAEELAYRFVLDPDGRPRWRRLTGTY